MTPLESKLKLAKAAHSTRQHAHLPYPPSGRVGRTGLPTSRVHEVHEYEERHRIVRPLHGLAEGSSNKEGQLCLPLCIEKGT